MDQGGYPAFFDEVVKLAFTPEFVSANASNIAALKEKRIQINSPIAIGRATDACMAFDLKGKISRISLPTLVLSGRRDVFTPIHLAEEIHRSIQGSEWKIMEDMEATTSISSDQPRWPGSSWNSWGAIRRS